MTEVQYRRKVSLIVSDSKGSGIDLSKLRIVFYVKLSDSQSPNVCRVRVYNLSQDVVSEIQKAFTTITLQAGYDANFGTIFDGNIKQVIYGSENNVDTFIDISSGDGDFAYNYSIVHKTLAAGATQKHIVEASVESMEVNGVSMGFMEEDLSAALSRSKVMYGMSRNYLRSSSKNTQTTWSIQNGKYQSVGLTNVLPNEAVVLNSKSGLIGTPNQTNDGIMIRSLLNPNLKVAAQVQVNQNDIMPELIDNQTVTGDIQNTKPSPIAADGFYRILIAEHSGDTRGNDWYTSMTALSMDKTSEEGNQVKKNG